MRFTKMEGLGNDYIYLNGLEGLPEDLPALARRMSDRHFGVGGDGIICICPRTGPTSECGCSTPTAQKGRCAATASAAWANTSTIRA